MKSKNVGHPQEWSIGWGQTGPLMHPGASRTPFLIMFWKIIVYGVLDAPGCSWGPVCPRPMAHSWGCPTFFDFISESPSRTVSEIFAIFHEKMAFFGGVAPENLVLGGPPGGPITSLTPCVLRPILPVATAGGPSAPTYV